MSEHVDSPGVERVIRARRGWLRIDVAALWRYRDLLWLTVRRDVVSRYQQTILGPLWFLIQPVVTALVFTMVFGARGDTRAGPPSFLFYLGGMLAWNYFANIVGTAGNTFHGNAGVFTKVYFPRLLVPLAVVVSNLIPLAIQAVLFLTVYGLTWSTKGDASWQADAGALWLLPWCVAHTALFALGVSLVTSSLSAKYRDLQHALPFFMQTGLFVTPVIFPLGQLGETARAVMMLNPLTPVVETVRRGFFGTGGANGAMFGLSLVVTALLLVVGLALFQRTERTFADMA